LKDFLGFVVTFVVVVCFGKGICLIPFDIWISICLISLSLNPAFFNSFKNSGSLFCTSIGFILSHLKVGNTFINKALNGSTQICLIIGN
jgi:hypothetical protein